jgi:quercetin dioxygenase-like cupin family protein
MNIVRVRDVEPMVTKEQRMRRRRADLINARVTESRDFDGDLVAYAPGGYAPPHYHDGESLLYALEGEATVKVSGRSYKIKQDTLVFFAPNEVHEVKNTGKGLFRMIEFFTPQRPKLKTVFVGGEKSEFVPEREAKIRGRLPRLTSA